jgi:hypothetical protein
MTATLVCLLISTVVRQGKPTVTLAHVVARYAKAHSYHDAFFVYSHRNKLIGKGLTDWSASAGQLIMSYSTPDREAPGFSLTVWPRSSNAARAGQYELDLLNGQRKGSLSSRAFYGLSSLSGAATNVVAPLLLPETRPSSWLVRLRWMPQRVSAGKTVFSASGHAMKVWVDNRSLSVLKLESADSYVLFKRHKGASKSGSRQRFWPTTA